MHGQLWHQLPGQLSAVPCSLLGFPCSKPWLALNEKVHLQTLILA